MSLFEKFLGSSTPAPAAEAPKPTQPAGTPTPPGNIPEPTVPSEAGQGTIPTLPDNLPKQGDIPETPLANFQGLWDANPKPTEGEQSTTSDITKDNVSAAISNINFAGGISEEQFNAVYSGGEQAASALPEILNNVAKNVMTQATLVNHKLAQREVERALAARANEIPAKIREQSVTEHLRTTNPMLDNPAIKPVVEATKSQLLTKYPDATNEQITQMTVNYLQEMQKVVNPAAYAPEPSPDESEDWAKFLDM